MATPIQQLLSRSIFATDGVSTIWDFSFSGGYLDRTHIKAYVQPPVGERTDLVLNYDTQLIGPFQLRITPALASGSELHIYRDTPKNLPLVDFTDGAVNSEIALDTNAKQAVFVAAEATDLVNLIKPEELIQLISDADDNAVAAAAGAASASASAVSASSSASSASASASGAATSLAQVNTATSNALQYSLNSEDSAVNSAASAASASASSTSAGNSAASLPFVRNLHRGFQVTVSGGNMTVAEGQAADSTNTVVINHANSLTKTMASWSVGAGGMLDTGAVADNTWYYIFAIRRPDTQVVDLLASLSFSTPTMPANYTQRRLVAAWRRASGGVWESWTMRGTVVMYDSNRLVSGFPGTVRTNRTATLPNRPVLAYLSGQFTSGASAYAAVFSDPAGPNLVPDTATYFGQVQIQAAFSYWQGALPPVYTTGGEIADRATSSQIGNYGVIGFDLEPALR